MKRISSILIALVLALTLTVSMSACNIGAENSDNGGTETDTTVPKENKLQLLTGTNRAVSRDSYKTIKGIKHKVSAYSCEEIGIIEAEEYPLLNETLKGISSDRLSNAKEINKLFRKRAIQNIDFGSKDYMGEYFSYNLSNRITRSDEVCFSFLENIQSYSGGPHPDNYSVSHNINTKTGKEYKLSEVFVDVDALIQKTSGYLYEKYGEDAGVFFSKEGNEIESAISAGLKKSFFKRRKGMDELGNDFSYYSPSWVLTGQGVSLIFDPYTIGPYALGTVRVDFTYKELEGIINDDFVSETETYVIPALLYDDKIPYDFDHDGIYDEIELATEFISAEKENDRMIIDKVTVKKGDLSITRDCGAYSIMPYAVHMSDGSDYLYICCDKFFENYILIFNITGDFLEYMGRQSGSFAYGSLTNPESVYVSERINLLSTYDGVKAYKLLNNGKFSTEAAYYDVRGFDKHLTSTEDMSLPLYKGEEAVDNLKETHNFKAGTEFEIIHTDGETFADLREVGGELTGRLYITMPEGTHPAVDEQYLRETGDLIKDVFEELYFTD